MRQDVKESEGEYERIQQKKGRSGGNEKNKKALKQTKEE